MDCACVIKQLDFHLCQSMLQILSDMQFFFSSVTKIRIQDCVAYSSSEMSPIDLVGVVLKKNQKPKNVSQNGVSSSNCYFGYVHVFWFN